MIKSGLSFRRILPWAVLSVRAILTPVLLLGVRSWHNHSVLLMYLIAFVTDYFDGVVARRLGTATPALRQADSVTDTFFHLALAVYLILRCGIEFRKNILAVSIYALTLLAWCTLDAFRWHRLAGFHMLSSKLFSIGICIWIIVLLAGHATGHLLSILMLLGVISNIEGIAISLKLSRDRADVLTLFSLQRAAIEDG